MTLDAMKKKILLIGYLLSLVSVLSAKSYTLTLDYNRQLENDTASIEMDSRFGFPITDLSSNSEARFLGFTDGKKLYEVGDEPKFKKDTTLVAVWEDPVVTFDLGYPGAPAIPSETFTYGDILTLPDTSVRDGYTFVGWVDTDKYEYLDSGEKLQLFDDYDFVAEWQAEELPYYTVEVNYGYDDKEEEYTIQKGKTFIVPNPGTRLGYTFAGWKNGYKPGDEIIIDSNTRFNAEWDRDGYTVEFRYHDNRISDREYTSVRYGNTYTLPDFEDRDDGIFIGWTDGTNNYEPGTEIVITGSVVFDAVWEYRTPSAELYTEWINEGGPVMSKPIIEAILSGNFHFNNRDIDVSFCNGGFSLTTFDGYTAYFAPDSGDTYVVVIDGVDNTAFRITSEGSREHAMYYVDFFLETALSVFIDGTYQVSTTTNDMSQYIEAYLNESNGRMGAMFFEREKLDSISVHQGYQDMSWPTDFSTGLTEADIAVPEQYNVIDSSDINRFGIDNLFSIMM